MSCVMLAAVTLGADSPPPASDADPAGQAARTASQSRSSAPPSVLAPSVATLTFPNSGAPGAQPLFLRGVAWLHSFGYEDAIDAFVAAQRIDPGFALAYWGESLSYSQPLWFSEDIVKGRAALAKLAATPDARQARARTPREKGLLAAVEQLWGSGDVRTRALAYASAMGRLAAAFPGDDEIQLFHALSLLGTLPRGDQALPIRERAGAIAQAVFAGNPKHPGAAHYIIHAYDHGALAARALPAARAYASIAPGVSHALHMPAHTFLQLGLWDQAAEADRQSWDASVQWVARRRLPQTARDFHSLTWLHYAWTQQGRFREAAGAQVIVSEALKTAAADVTIGGHQYMDSTIGRGQGPEALRNDRGSMRARYVIESGRWTELRGASGFEGIDDLFALGLSAVKLGDADRVAVVIREFEKVVAPGQPADMQEQGRIMLLEMQALHLFAQGKRTEAFSLMEGATQLQSRMPKPIGRPFPVKGADELYAELLYEAGRYPEAVRWFEATLQRTPNRTRPWLGMARAKRRMGDAAGSRAAYERVMANWHRADESIPELTEVRAALGRR
jgi:tetratricopeptide (TPR) repeat protein